MCAVTPGEARERVFTFIDVCDMTGVLNSHCTVYVPMNTYILIQILRQGGMGDNNVMGLDSIFTVFSIFVEK